MSSSQYRNLAPRAEVIFCAQSSGQRHLLLWRMQKSAEVGGGGFNVKGDQTQGRVLRTVASCCAPGSVAAPSAAATPASQRTKRSAGAAACREALVEETASCGRDWPILPGKNWPACRTGLPHPPPADRPQAWPSGALALQAGYDINWPFSNCKPRPCNKSRRRSEYEGFLWTKEGSMGSIKHQGSGCICPSVPSAPREAERHKVPGKAAQALLGSSLQKPPLPCSWVHAHGAPLKGGPPTPALWWSSSWDLSIAGAGSSTTVAVGESPSTQLGGAPLQLRSGDPQGALPWPHGSSKAWKSFAWKSATSGDI
ncbi:uncharacterized protein LOC144178817 isoform X2 [Haemaphysalis longicornis]